jgi:NADPH-dependent curcumin reductase CurA
VLIAVLRAVWGKLNEQVILYWLANADAISGVVLDQVIPRIKQYGRIAACGAISGEENVHPGGMHSY